jgi:NAD(P)-dependent dehydrogenase (short-subunit alcohol dehydrogenase family)
VPAALVTGANRGIGREVARQLAARDYDVILTARDEEKARVAAEELGARPLQLDVSDPASIEAAAESVGELDVLVNNAGVVLDGGIAGTDPDFEALQRTLDTNFFGAYRLTIALLPLLRESEHARVVNASTLPDDGPTGASSATASPSLSSRRSGLALKACT